MKNKILFLGLMCVLVFSCKKDPVTSDSVDYFIFGIGYCECGGQCAQLYKYTADALVKGEGQWCSPDDYTYDGLALSTEDHVLAEALLNNLPDDLYDSEITTFGCPDCHDQGGYYVEIKQDGEVKSWRLDTDTEAIPAFLVPFRQHLRETLDVLH